MGEADFAFVPGVHAAIVGPDSIVGAFRREYAPLETLDRTGRTLRIEFGRRSRSPTADMETAVGFQGRHKSVSWRVGLSPAEAADLRVSIELAGAPRSFARSLVQGYVVEPMLSVVSAEAGVALVPSAGVAMGDGVTLILGRSGAGKSTLMARLAAAGQDVLGDDQVFVDVAGQCRAFPRRLRFYPDIESTAPEAFSRLPAGAQRRLRLRKLLSAGTLGYVRPSLSVDRSAVGGHWVPGPIAIERVVLLERGVHVGGLRSDAATVDEAIDWAARLLSEQRGRIELGDDPAWRVRLRAVAARESEILATAFRDRSIQRLVVPRDRPANEAIAAVAEHLGLALEAGPRIQ